MTCDVALYVYAAAARSVAMDRPPGAPVVVITMTYVLALHLHLPLPFTIQLQLCLGRSEL